MSLQLCSIASGSKGNCTLVTSSDTALLVDAGVALSRVSEVLASMGLTLSDLSGVLITHEHSDHVAYLSKLSSYAAVYAHPETLRAIPTKFGAISNVVDVYDYENGFSVGDIAVTPFRTPHDAVHSLGYTFECSGKRVSVATDIGLPTRGVLRNISQSEIVLLEANHDIEMLKSGNYPEWLKRRILGEKGHLSNDAAALLAEKIADMEVHDLILGHISHENNMPGLALNTVCDRLARNNVGKDMHVTVALQDRATEVYRTI